MRKFLRKVPKSSWKSSKKQTISLKVLEILGGKSDSRLSSFPEILDNTVAFITGIFFFFFSLPEISGNSNWNFFYKWKAPLKYLNNYVFP